MHSCRSCGAHVFWVRWARGGYLPVDIRPQTGALTPETRHLVVLSQSKADGALSAEPFHLTAHGLERNRYTMHEPGCARGKAKQP